MHHIVKSLLRHARRSKSASARNIHPKVTSWHTTLGSFCATRGRSTQAQVTQKDPLPNQSHCPVSSYNEWDPLEEVIVGRAYGSNSPALHPQLQAVVQPHLWNYPPCTKEDLDKAHGQCEELVRILKAEGVKVRRPEEWDWTNMGTFRTPYFESEGYKTTCPRDGLLVVGDEIIESAMGMRCRLFEFHPYRKLLLEYFRNGATWTAAPRPVMHDDLYRKDFPQEDFEKQGELLKEGKFILTEAEVVFEAADCIRFGRDIFVTLTHTTNRGGVEWLRRHLSPKGFRVHSLLFHGTQNCHADATFMPLNAGLMIVAEGRPCLEIDDVPVGWEYFEERGWKVLRIPKACYLKHLERTSKWLHINALSLDGERVLIQKDEVILKKMLQQNGITPIEVDMSHCFGLGGALHCWTNDIRRQGTLEDYGLD